MTDQSHLPAQAQEVLDFWFQELTPEQWWHDDQLDKVIAARFGALYEQLRKDVPDAWLQSPEALLAAIIVLDQFPRNMFRGSAAAFASDAQARRLSSYGVSRGFDRALSVDQRLFLYLPFEHSEDAADQARAVELISVLGNAQYTEFALQHKAVIDRFGRFPQRNAALSRVSTAEEEEFLNAGRHRW